MFAIYENTKDNPDIIWFRFNSDVSKTNWNCDNNVWYGRARNTGAFNPDGALSYNDITDLQAISTAQMAVVVANDQNSYELARNGTSDLDYRGLDPIGKLDLTVATDLHLQFDHTSAEEIIGAFTTNSLTSVLYNGGDGVYSSHIGFIGPDFPSASPSGPSIAPCIGPKISATLTKNKLY